MARKNISLNDLIDDSRSPSWATALRRGREESKLEEENRLAKVNAILPELEAQGLSEAALQDVARQIMETGDFDVPVVPQAAATAQPTATPVLPAESPVPAEEGRSGFEVAYRAATGASRTLVDSVLGEGYFDALVDTGQAGIARMARGGLTRASESDNPVIRLLAEVPGGLTDLATGNLEDYILRLGGRSGVAADRAALAEIAERNEAAAAPVRERLGSRNWLVRNLGEGALDVVASPSSAASLIGGPVGTLSILDAYDQAYTQAVDAGIDSEEDRELWALSQSAPELVSLIPASKVLQKLPVIGNAIDRMVKKPINNLAAKVIEREGSPALKAALRTVNTALGEAAEEGFTGGVQDIAAGVTAATAGEQLAELARGNVSSTFGGAEENGTFADVLWKSARAGFIAGGGLSAPGNVGQSYADRAEFVGRRSAETEADILANQPVLPSEAPAAPVPTPEPVQDDLFGTTDDAPSFEEQEAARQRSLEEEVAWAQRRREREGEQQEARREELRQSIINRVDTARQEVEVLQERIEAGDVDSATLNSAAAASRRLRDAEESLRSFDEKLGTRAPVTEETVAEPTPAREPVQRDFVQEQEESARVKQINDISRRRKTFEQNKAKKAGDEQKKAKAAEANLRNRAIDSLFDEGLSDAEVADALPARMSQLREEALAKKQEAAKPAAKKTAKQPAPAKKEPKTAPDVEKLKASDSPYDRAQAEVLERLGMTAPKGTKEPDDFRQKVRRIATELAKDSSARAAAVENLIKQGKVRIVPNAQAAGREDLGRVGEYDVDSGTTYIYTDHLDDNVHAAVMEAAAHETAHLGQFNQRDKRPEMVKAVLGDRYTSEAARKLRAAARSGNRFAQEALAAAESDTEARRQAGETNPERYEDAELVAYAVGAENRGRTSVLGSAGGALRDAVAGARSQLRKRVGLNLDISVNDLRSAMTKVLQEGTETSTAADSTADVLGMIYNQNSRGFEKALRQGRVYTSKDGELKYVLSDADATINEDARKKLLDGKAVKLGDLMSHDVLYDEHPEARSLTVSAISLPGTTHGMWQQDEIIVDNDVAAGRDPSGATLREVLMHEIQHFVQERGGYSDMFFDGTALFRAKEETVAATEKNDAAADALLDAAPEFKNSKGEALPDNVRREVMRILMDRHKKPAMKAVAIAGIIDHSGIRLDKNSRNVYNDFVDSLTEYREARELALNIQADYIANITEREAFRTQLDVDLPQDQIDARGNPERVMSEQMQDTESGRRAAGRIDVPARTESLGMAANPRRVEVLDILDNSTFYRGSRSAGDIPYVSDGALGPGHYLTSDRRAAESYGPNVGEWQVDVAAPLVVEMEDVEKFEGNTARALVENERFWKENFNTKGGAVRWANEQWDNWAGIGDPDFTSMLRDAGFDSVALMNGRDVVELNVPSRRQIVTPSDTTLGMAARRGSTAFRNRSKFGTALISLIRNDKGLGAHIRNEIELAKAAPVEYEAKANRAAGKFDNAVKQLAEQRGVEPSVVNAEIRDALESIAEMEGSASEYLAEFNKIADKYGKAGNALKELRQIVDDLSLEFIRTYLDSGVKLTEKEKDDIRKVGANLGRYVHRFYAARLGRGLGKMYSESVQKAVDLAREKGRSALTPKQQELLDRYNGAAKAILDGVLIPDADNIGDLPDAKLNYLYETWIGTDQTRMERDQKEAELLELRDQIGPEQLQQKVDDAAQALLHGVREAAATRYYDRGEKLDTTILKERTKIPKEIRALMGEVTDPAGALLNTVSKQAEYVARTKLMLHLRNAASSQDLQPPGSGGNAAVRANNMTKLTGESYGPLEGYYASPALRAMIDDTAESLMNFSEAITTGSRNNEAAVETFARGAARVWMKGAAAAKTKNIIGNLFRYPLNFAGSFAMLGLNGNVNVKSYGRGLSDAVDIIRYAAKPSAGLGGAVLASKYRVVDSATVGDLKNLDVGKIEQVVREMSGKSPGAFLRKARELGMAGRELYAMMDVWSKIANFHAEASFLRDLYKAEGIDKTDDQIYREASDIVTQTNMSYIRTLPFIKVLERGGITQYGPYLYEAHRVVFANLYQGVRELYRAKDMNNSKAAAMMAARGGLRILGTGGTLSMLAYLSHLAAGMWGDDEEEKRSLLPEYSRIMDFLYLGKDADDLPVLYAVSNVDPIGPITDLYRAARLGEGSMEAVWEQFKENYIAPSLAGATWDAFARTTGIVEPTSSRPRKPLLQQWFPNGWAAVTSITGNEDVLASIAHLAETRYLPGTARAWGETNPTVASGGVGEIVWNTSRLLGARGIRYNPEVGVMSASFAYDDTIKQQRRKIAAYLETATSPFTEELLDRVASTYLDEKKAWDQLALVRDGLYAVGYDETDVAAELKKARVPKEVITQLLADEFEPRVLSKRSLKSAAAGEIRRAKSEAAKARVEAKWETVMEMIGELQGDE